MMWLEDLVTSPNKSECFLSKNVLARFDSGKLVIFYSLYINKLEDEMLLFCVDLGDLGDMSEEEFIFLFHINLNINF